MRYSNKYNKWVSIFLAAILVTSVSIAAIDVFSPDQALACHDQGCNAWFWKCHTNCWFRYTPCGMTKTIFYRADIYNLGENCLLDVLGFNWGFGYSSSYFAACSLLREGIAAKLNVANPYIDYHYSGSYVTYMVNEALASGDCIRMNSLAQSLYRWNNAGSPF